MRNFTFSILGGRGIALAVLCLLATVALRAQTNLYTFSQSAGSYTPITGGTIIGQAITGLSSGTEGQALDDTTFLAVPIPFSFNFNGTAYSAININTNGWASFSTTTSTSSGLSATTNAISAWGADLMGIYAGFGTFTSGSPVVTAVSNTATCTIGAAIQGAGIPAGTTIVAFDATSITLSAPATANSTGTYLSWATGEIRTETIGVAPNRTFVIQWKGMATYSSSLSTTSNNTTCNFQIRLSEGGGVSTAQTISIMYGTMLRVAPTTGSQSGQVGIRGGSASTDFNNRTTTTDWAATTAGSSNSSTVTWTPAVYPVSGLTYIWTPFIPLNMSYVSSTTTQAVTSAVAGGSANSQIIGLEVVTLGSLSPFTVTNINFSTNGTTLPADITQARVYYTGTSSTFATTTQFGTAKLNPNGTFSVAGSQVLTGSPTTNATNYFWLAYDLSCSAAGGNVVDGECASFDMGSNYVPTITAPTGSRSITAFATPVPATSQPSTTSTVSGAINAQVLQVNVGASICLTSITQLNFTNASTNVADIAKARVYYTTSSTFAATTQFGSDVVAPGASFSVTGTLTPATTGTLYFWLVYDIDCSAPSVAANVADASFTGMVTNLGTLTATTANPTGTRTITVVTSGDNIQNAPDVVLGSAGGNPFDISGKTLQVGEPSPIIHSQPNATNGVARANYSWGSAAGGTQWFKLTVPTTGYGSSGNLLIRGTTPTSTPSADVQLALWKFPNLVPGGSCSSIPNFSGGVLLAANDDAIVTGTGYTNAGTLNSVIRVRLKPGSTYYIQMDGYTTALPTGDLIVEDLADAAGKNVPNNGFGIIHNPTGADMRFASYEVIGDDGWTYYYSNNGTSTNISDDIVLMGLNWSTSTTYLWNGTSATGNDLLSHVRRDATSASAPSTTVPGSGTGSDAFIVWSGRNNVADVSPDLKSTAPYVAPYVSHWWMMNKFWNVYPNQQPVTSIGVRYFYTNADYDTLNTAVTGGGGTPLAAHSNMQFLKFTKSPTTHYTNAEIDPALGQAAITAASATKLAWTNTDAVYPGINQAEFNITTFSGGGGGGGTSINPLPITLVYFNGSKTIGGNLLSWKINSTSSNMSFQVERSADSRNYAAIGSLSADQNRAVTPFDFTDNKPVAGINYYRIKITDVDGKVSYTNVVAINNKVSGIEIIGLQPTLVQNDAMLYIAAAKAGKLEISVTDMTGKKLKAQTISVVEGENKVTMNFGSLAAGIYNLSSINESGKSTIRFVKQ